MECPTFLTERLMLRPLAMSDAPAMQRRFPRWDVVQWLEAGVPWPFPRDGAERAILSCLQRQARDERAYWAITLRDDPAELIGRISLASGDGSRDQRGFWIDPEHQRLGLMSEAADRITAHAFNELGWTKLWLTNAAANIASSRIKTRQGAKLIALEMGDYVAGRAAKEIWLLDRSSWLPLRQRD
jgi:ribosomal-protein-alanine N-acetyltransferase